MYYIGFCPVCEQGALGIRVCSGLGHGVVLCDECDAMWLSLDLTRPAVFLSAAGLTCLHCGGSLDEPPAHWATWDELERLGWQTSVQGQGESLGDGPDSTGCVDGSN
jgi:hypothetical protein